MSTAFRRMPARFIASVSRSILGRGSLIGLGMDLMLRLILGTAFGTGNRRGLLRTRRPVLVAGPPHRTRIQGIDRLDPGFGMVTFLALVMSVRESFRSRRHGNRNHPRLAIRAARTVDRQQLWIR